MVWLDSDELTVKNMVSLCAILNSLSTLQLVGQSCSFLGFAANWATCCLEVSAWKFHVWANHAVTHLPNGT